MSAERTPGPAGFLRGLVRRDRLTGQVAIGLVGVLVIGAVVYGVGVASAKYHLSDVGAWLSASRKGIVVHANGLAGKVDGKASLLADMRGHKIKVVQDGGTVLLVDEQTGVVSRIDPSQLKVAQSRPLGVGLQVVIGGGAAYTLDSVKGSVQRIDPVTLSAIGQPAALPPPLGQAGIDGQGRLWVPTPQNGQVVPFQGGQAQRPVTVGKAGDRLWLTVAAGTPVVTNSSEPSTLIIKPDGTQKVNLPATVTQAARAGGMKAPSVTDGQVLPMLGPRGALVLLDTGVGRVTSVALRMANHVYEAPHVLGPRIYIPDRTTGRLVVFNTQRGDFDPEIPVTSPGGVIEIIVKDHMLWANDPNGSNAIALDQNGTLKRIRKYDDRVPGGPRRPIPTRGRPGGNNGNQNDGGGNGDNGGNNPGQPPPRAPRLPQQPQQPQPNPPKTDPAAPDPPTVTQASGDNGRITVQFTPAQQPATGTLPVRRFVLLDASDQPVANADPQSIPPGSQARTFTVSGLGCDRQQHSYKVGAEYVKDGQTAYSRSGLVSAYACAAPGDPSGFTADPVNRGAKLNWNAASGYDVSYILTGTNAPGGEIKGTAYTVSGLTNNRTYTYTLKARNGAGESSGSQQQTADLSYPRQTFRNANNNETNTIIRPGPSKTGEVGRIQQGQYIDIRVICQLTGQSVTESETGETSSVWNRIEWNGGVGYLSETLMTTPRGYPDNGLFQCDD